MGKKNKYYVVWVGKNPGIYSTWKECQEEISGIPEARYKSFSSKSEAEKAYSESPDKYWGKSTKPVSTTLKNLPPPQPFSICVDGAASGKTKKIEYQGVFTETGTQVFHAGPFEEGTNNIAEFLAIVHALAWCKKNKLEYPIYSDSRTAMSWVRKRKVNTKLQRTPKNKKLFQVIERGLYWLNNNVYTNPILKWETTEWGENPADFGRK